MINPFLQEVDPIIQILDPAGQWFHGEESLFIPDLGHLVIKQTVADQFQLLTHDNKSFDCLLDITEVLLHDGQQPVVPDNLLNEHSIHRFFIAGWIFLLDFVDREDFGGTSLDRLGYLGNCLFTRFAALGRGFGLHREN